MPYNSVAPLPEAVIQELQEAIELIQRTKQEIHKVVFGQEKFIEAVLIPVLCGKNGLLVGLPGLAKTLAAEAVARASGLQFGRIQFTPDLMPKEIIGTEIIETNPDTGEKTLRFIKGPVFAQLLIGDEINRASPRTQSAILQAMQEHRVSVDGNPMDLPEPFIMLATQNPVEQEGTYPLPEAQLDRFIMHIDVGYPDRDTELRIMFEGGEDRLSLIRPVLDADKLLSIQALLRKMPVGLEVGNAIVDLVRALRTNQEKGSYTEAYNKLLKFGPGPRGPQSLLLACKAKALIEGRMTPSLQDVIELAVPVLKHRMASSFTANAMDEDTETLIRKALPLFLPTGDKKAATAELKQLSAMMGPQ